MTGHVEYGKEKRRIGMKGILNSSELADLFDELVNADDRRTRKKIERAINQQMNAQRELAHSQLAAAQLMWDEAKKIIFNTGFSFSRE